MIRRYLQKLLADILPLEAIHTTLTALLAIEERREKHERHQRGY
jgi:hypothetical protein